MVDFKDMISRSVTAIDCAAAQTDREDARKTIADISQAATAAEQRIAEIGAELSNFERDSGEIADALLSGTNASQAALAGPSRGLLEEERDALLDGLRELRQRVDTARQKRDNAENAIFAAIGSATAPAMATLVDQAKAEAAALAQTMLKVAALAQVTRNFGLERVAAEKVLLGLSADNLLIDRTDRIAVPIESREALQPISEFPGVGLNAPTFVVPVDQSRFVVAAAVASQLG